MTLARLFLLLAISGVLVAADKPSAKKTSTKSEEKAVAPTEKAVPRTELKAQVAPGASLKFDFPELTVDRHGALAACHLTLPAGYEAAKKYPLVVWLGGGEGGNQPSGAFLPAGDFILVGLPYPKGATVIGSEMAGTGHAFAVTEHPKVAEWLTNVAFATPAKK